MKTKQGLQSLGLCNDFLLKETEVIFFHNSPQHSSLLASDMKLILPENDNKSCLKGSRKVGPPHELASLRCCKEKKYADGL